MRSSVYAKTNSDASVRLGKIWKMLDHSLKQGYIDLANEESKLHKMLFPMYKYQPKKKRLKRSVPVKEHNEQPIPSHDDDHEDIFYNCTDFEVSTSPVVPNIEDNQSMPMFDFIPPILHPRPGRMYEEHFLL